jgi:hypothetical protein
VSDLEGCPGPFSIPRLQRPIRDVTSKLAANAANGNYVHPPAHTAYAHPQPLNQDAGTRTLLVVLDEKTLKPGFLPTRYLFVAVGYSGEEGRTQPVVIRNHL